MEQIWASGGMVYTLVLEASAERIESSSLSLPTKFGVEASMVMQWTVNPPSLTRLVRSQDTPPVIAGRVRSPARSHKPLPSLVQIQVPQPNLWKCDRVRFIVAVLKTAVSKGTVSSNLTVSAKFLFMCVRLSICE